MFASRLITLATLTLTALIIPHSMARPAAEAYELKKYTAADSSYVLYKPQDWKVQEEARPDSLRIVVADPPGTSLAEIYCARNPAGNIDSLRLLGDFGGVLKSEHPDLAVSEVYASSDRTRAVATVSFTKNKALLKGRYYFESSPRQVSVQGYYAPVAEVVGRRSLLVDILSNLHFVKGKSGESDRRFRPEMKPITAQLVPRQAPDGSVRISVPADWNFQAMAGKVVTAAPEGRAGFASTSFQMMPVAYGAGRISQGVIISPYRSPSQFLPLVFSKLGNRDVKVQEHQADLQTAQDCLKYLGRRCEAEDLEVRWVSPAGSACRGAFKMMNAAPSVTGMWFTILTGFWGPENDNEFIRWVPLLEQIGSSFGINDQFSRRYIQQGLANLKQLQQKTAHAMEALNKAREDNLTAWEKRQAAKDFMDSKWDDYRRGNSYWISDMEGGKIYATDSGGTRDTQTGGYIESNAYNYTHFEGQNPRHPSETMREVSSYEVQQILGLAQK